ncbi:MAG: hypothetical protein WCK82_12650 [Bacteroidota bacterium]
MKKIYFLLVAIALTASLSANAQKKKKAKNDVPKDRIEYNLEEQGYSGTKKHLFPMDSSGFVMMLYDMKESGYIFKKFNSNLTEKYELNVNCEKGSVLLDKLVANGKIYLLFSYKLGSYQVVEFDPETKKMINIDCAYDKPNFDPKMIYKDGNIMITSFYTISAGKQLGRACYSVILLGVPIFFNSLNFPTWVNVSKLNLKKKKFETELIDDFGKHPRTSYIGGNAGFEGKTGNIIIKNATKNRKAQVYAKSFKIDNGEIKLGESVEISIEDKKKEIYTAVVNNYNETDKLILGNYGNKGHNHYGTQLSDLRLKGVYYSKMEGKRLKWINTYSFKEIIPKDQYVKFKRAHRNGIVINVGPFPFYVTFYNKPGYSGTQVLMHDVIETDNEFISVGETRTAKFHYEIEKEMGTVSVSSRGGGGSTQGKVKKVLVFDGYEYNGFLINCFSKEGKLLWTKTIKYANKMLSFNEDRRFLDVAPEGDKLGFSYFNGTAIVKYYLNEDMKFEDKPVISRGAKITNKNDETKGLKYDYDYAKWTDDTYLIFGTATIKTSKAELKKKRDANGNKIKKKRTVLYISKVVVETEDK